jgi:ribA/ribD-fused uncharacterized protein
MIDQFTKFSFFRGGPLSQWYPCKFKINGIEFNCAEQATMYHKALLFKDADTADLILKALGPKEQKVLGRRVRNFDEERWTRFREIIVKTINIYKFKQCRHPRNVLLDTKGTLIVEASPLDVIWGIGLSDTDERRFYPHMWRGQNLLGKILTQIRLRFEREPDWE